MASLQSILDFSLDCQATLTAFGAGQPLIDPPLIQCTLEELILVFLQVDILPSHCTLLSALLQGVYSCPLLVFHDIIPDFVIFFVAFFGVFIFLESAGQPFFGKPALTASRGIAATGGTGISGNGGPLSKGLSHGTNAEFYDHKALHFLAARFPS